MMVLKSSKKPLGLLWVIAYLLHHGLDHESGHYTLAVCDGTSYSHADDAVRPTPLPAISRKMTGEILQVWLVHETPAIRSTVAVPAPPSTKNVHFESAIVQMMVSNLTCCGAAVVDGPWNHHHHHHQMIQCNTNNFSSILSELFTLWIIALCKVSVGLC